MKRKAKKPKALALPLPESLARELMAGAKSEVFAQEFDAGSMCVIMTARPDKLPTLEDADRLWKQQIQAMRGFVEMMERLDVMPSVAVAKARGDA